MLGGMWAWPESIQAYEFAGLLLTAVLVSGLTVRTAVTNGATMAPAFVLEFGALLLLGPHAAVCLTTSGVVARRLGQTTGACPPHQVLVQALTAAAAIQVAGLAHGTLSGAMGAPGWPWQAVPIAAAAIIYCIVSSASGARW